MAEVVGGQTHTTTPSGASKSKQYIRASANDDALEPDALRGTTIAKDSGIEDEDEERRKKIEGKS